MQWFPFLEVYELYRVSFLKRTSKLQTYRKTYIVRKTITGDVEYDLYILVYIIFHVLQGLKKVF